MLIYCIYIYDSKINYTSGLDLRISPQSTTVKIALKQREILKAGLGAKLSSVAAGHRRVTR